LSDHSWHGLQRSNRRLEQWTPWIEAQPQFLSMYTSFFQSVPAFLNGGGKTVAEDDAGLEPAETADGNSRCARNADAHLESLPRCEPQLLDSNQLAGTGRGRVGQ